MPRATVSVLVLDPRVREPDVPIVLRQLVFPCPACNLFGLSVRAAVEVLLPSIALVQEALIIALELVVEDHSPDSPALSPQSLLRALVGAIDLCVVRQFARLPEPSVEGLSGLVRAVVAVVSVGFEEVSPALRQDDGAVVRAERRCTNQSFVLEMLEASPRALGVVADVVKIASGDHPKYADRRQATALGAVDLVDAVTVAYLFSITSTRKLEIPREHVTRKIFAVSLTCTAAADEASVPRIPAVPAVGSRIVSVEHDPLHRIERAYDEASATTLIAIRVCEA